MAKSVVFSNDLFRAYFYNYKRRGEGLRARSSSLTLPW
jgi:hypothetical protein